MNKNNFCSLPFTEIFLGPDGGIKTCCSSRENIGNLNEQKIEDILLSPNAKRIRQNIINGTWDPACAQCQRQEIQNVSSERSLIFHDSFKNLSNEYFNLKRLDLRWSNTCNLSCVYCYEYFSSKWAMIKGIKVNTLKDENEQDFIEYVERNKTTVENIMMLGGEPLLQKQNVNLLDVIPNSSVYILTNLAVPLENNPLSHKLILYKNVHYAVSFETVGTRFEYVRHGADWSVFNNNLEYLKNNVENFTVDIHALYSPYSAFNLVEFYEYILEKKLFKSVFWSLLTSSGENSSVFDTLLIPSLRLLAIKEIEKCEVLFPGEIGIDALTDIKNLLIYRKPGDGNTPRMLQELGSVESKLNKQPGKKFQDLWPDVYKELT